MHELRFVGLSDDGSRLLLSDDEGRTYAVPIDERLSASLRRDRPRAGQHEEESHPLSPREVQARIRGGASAEEVAAEHGWDLAHVRRYEGPPLAERAWIAERARDVEVRRPEGDTRLEDLVAERLETRGIGADALRWDAWKRDDGRWTVLLAYPAGQGDRVATWTYDPSGRTISADDDEARWLMEEPTPQPEPEPEERPRLVGLPTVGMAEDARHETIPVVRPLPAEVVSVTESVEVVEESVEVVVERPERAGAPGPDSPSPQAEPPAARSRGRKAKRASVPSWDEILFGAADRED